MFVYLPPNNEYLCPPSHPIKEYTSLSAVECMLYVALEKIPEQPNSRIHYFSVILLYIYLPLISPHPIKTHQAPKRPMTMRRLAGAVWRHPEDAELMGDISILLRKIEHCLSDKNICAGLGRLYNISFV